MLKRIAAIALTASMLSACGGGGSSTTPPVNGPQPKSGGTTTVAFTLKVPGSSIQTRRGRHPLYVSRDTKGIGIDFQAHSGSGYSIDSSSCTSGTPCTADSSPNAGMAIAPGSGSCGSAANDGSYSCTVYIAGVPVGYDDFRFTLWNAAPAALPLTCAANGTGCSFSGDKALSVQTLANYAILSGQNNTVPLTATFYPVVDSIATSISYTSPATSVVDGASSTVTASTTLRDANGDIIIGTDPLLDRYGNALSLTMNIANDVGPAGPSTCPAASSGAVQTKAEGCSLYFGTSGSPGTNPSFTTANGAAAAQTLTYDGNVAFPASVGTIAIGGTVSSAQTLNATINGHNVAYATTGVSLAADAAGLAAAINADGTDAALVYASVPAGGTTITITAAGGAALSLAAVPGAGTETEAASGAALVQAAPQVTIATNNGGNTGANLAATFVVTSSNTGSVGIPRAPQGTGFPLTGVPSSLMSGSDGDIYVKYGASGIDQVQTNGTVTSVTLEVGSGDAIGGIAAGSDGDLWWTDSTTHLVNFQAIGTGTAGTGHQTAALALDSLGAITAGGDGNMWFIDSTATALEQVNPNAPATITAHTAGIGVTGLGPVIAAGKFANGHRAICVAGQTGASPGVNCWDIDAPSAFLTADTADFSVANWPSSLVFGPDGYLYAGVANKTEIALNDNAGALSAVAGYSWSLSQNATGATIGKDGAVWLSEGKFVGRISIESGAAGTLEQYSVNNIYSPFCCSVAADLVNVISGSDGNLWASDVGSGGGQIGRINISGP